MRLNCCQKRYSGAHGAFGIVAAVDSSNVNPALSFVSGQAPYIESGELLPAEIFVSGGTVVGTAATLRERRDEVEKRGVQLSSTLAGIVRRLGVRTMVQQVK